MTHSSNEPPSSGGRQLARLRARFSRSAQPGLVALAAFVVGCSGSRQPELFAQGSPRNVLVISADTLRPDRLGAYGYEGPISPAIDRLAAQGTLFRRAFASSPWTLPSHASIFTGMYPHRHGVTNAHHRLSSDKPVLAELLQDAGLATLGIVSSHHLTQRTALDRGFQDFQYVSEWSSDDPATRFLHNPGRAITDQALQWMERHKDEPFFAFLHYYDCHSDYRPDPEYAAEFVSDYKGPADGSTAQLIAIRTGQREIGPLDARYLLELYEAEVRQLDDQIARLLDFLTSAGLDESTLVIFTSDHGEEFLEHGSVLHGRTYYDEVMAIPLLLRGPGIPKALEIDEMVSLVDVAETILGALELPVPAGMQGRDLARSWDSREASVRPFVLGEADWMNEQPNMYRMVRGKRYKLIHHQGSERNELYDLEDDPLELRNVVEANPEVTEFLLDRLRALMSSGSVESEAVQLDRETLERMRALGYTR